MEAFVTGVTIKRLREQKHLTQGALAEQIGVSDKTISKWETGKGLPDLSLLEPLASSLGISVAELFAGECIVNENKHSNVRNLKFYVCPICGNVITAMGELVVHCCGVKLPALEAEAPEAEHTIRVERIENEYYVRMEHEMTKDHYITFLCYVTSDECQLRKLYPEQAAEVRFPIHGHGFLYAYCKRDGLFACKI